MYLCNRNVLTENEIMVVRGKKKREEIVKEFGINMHTLLYLKWVTNKNLLYNTGNSVQLCDSLDRVWGRDLEENEYTYMYGSVSLLSTWNYQNIVNHLCVHAKSLQSCPALCNPMDHSPSGSSVHGISQARILELDAIPFSRDQTQVSCIVGRFFTLWATSEAQSFIIQYQIILLFLFII